jgi:hypothetical protein
MLSILKSLGSVLSTEKERKENYENNGRKHLKIQAQATTFLIGLQ